AAGERLVSGLAGGGFRGLARGALLGARALGGQVAARRLEVCTDEPVEELELVEVTDEEVVRDVVELLGRGRGLAVRGDDADVHLVERAEVRDRRRAAQRVVLPAARGDERPGGALRRDAAGRDALG